MKKIVTFILLIITSISLLAQDKNKILKKDDGLQESIAQSSVIFEGKIIHINKSFLSSKDSQTIYTSYTIQIDAVLSGNVSVGTVEIAVLGGQMIINGEGVSYTTAHGTGLCDGDAIFFCKPFVDGSSGIPHSNPIILTVNRNICINTDGSITPSLYWYEESYSSKTELYNDLRRYKSITIPKEKKSPNVDENKVRSNENDSRFNYEQNIKNYNRNFKLLLDKVKTYDNKKDKQVSANAITFQLANQTITGNNPRYFEFDITAAANINSLYFDGALFRLSYNTSAFGSEIVKNNKVTITKGNNFNTITYTNPNNDKIDQTSSSIGVPFNSNFDEKSWTRTLLTTSPVQLLHFKIEIGKCNENVNIDFTDQSITEMFSSYTTTPGAAITDALFFSTTNYQNPLNDILCQIAITNFTPKVNAGIEEVVEINGKGFGDVRGNGQVKFKSADDGGKSYIQKLDDVDYLLWTDKLIRIKVPSFIDSIKRITPGSGDFIVKNNFGDSVISTNKINFYYALNSIMANTNKYRTNLLNTNGQGGYTIRLDTSISNHPDILGCVKKAVRTWKCFTTVNWVIGSDTTVNKASRDGISTIFFTDEISTTIPNALAVTTRDDRYCLSTPIIAVNKSFDIGIKITPKWWYDTLSTFIPTDKFDFLETITHELGHALGLNHTNDDTQILYYSIQASGQPRRSLQQYSSCVEGGSDEVTKSRATIISQCNYKNLVPSTGSCNITTGIDLLRQNNFFMNVYPNPIINDELTIAFQSPENYNSLIVIYDIVGKEIYRTNLNNNKNIDVLHTIDVSNISSGMYFINLIIDNHKVSVKFIKN